LRQNLSPLSQDQINSLNALGMDIFLNPKQGENNHDGLSQSQVMNKEPRSLISELRKHNRKKFLRSIPELHRKNHDQNDNLNAVGLKSHLDAELLGRRKSERTQQDPISDLKSVDWDEADFKDQLRRNFADQTDDDWFQYYLWCREIENSGTKILAEFPTNKILGIKAWLRVQRALYRDWKLPEHRRQYLENLSHFEWR
jgi:hypothetical protein